jgi:hypothetical protein
VNARTQEQRDAEWLRAYGSDERVEFVRSLPSVASGKRPCVNAHIVTGGTSRKADCTDIVPLTWSEHEEELHKIGPRLFEAKYGINLRAAADETEAKFQKYLTTTTRPAW